MTRLPYCVGMANTNTRTTFLPDGSKVTTRPDGWRYATKVIAANGKQVGLTEYSAELEDAMADHAKATGAYYNAEDGDNGID